MAISDTSAKYKQFKELAIGQNFYYNGNNYVKQSSRTAALVNYGMRSFYFAQSVMVYPPQQEK